jgi:urease accessory protein
MIIHFHRNPRRSTQMVLGVVLLMMATLLATPALAHHAMAGNTPSNVLEGLLSGLAHPVIGVDHLAFVVAAGLLAVLTPRGWRIPIAFVLASLVGTGLHLASFTLPSPEVLIAISVLIVGGLLARQTPANTWLVVGFATIAGVFHGYAYGEAIVGATTSALMAYLSGFTVIQLAIAAIVYQTARSIRRSATEPDASLKLRFSGFTLCGAGIAFLSAALG